METEIQNVTLTKCQKERSAYDGQDSSTHNGQEILRNDSFGI